MVSLCEEFKRRRLHTYQLSSAHAFSSSDLDTLIPRIFHESRCTQGLPIPASHHQQPLQNSSKSPGVDGAMLSIETSTAQPNTSAVEIRPKPPAVGPLANTDMIALQQNAAGVLKTPHNKETHTAQPPVTEEPDAAIETSSDLGPSFDDAYYSTTNFDFEALDIDEICKNWTCGDSGVDLTP